MIQSELLRKQQRNNGHGYFITKLEKAPIYTLGSPDPRSFSRCKRAIAGSMVFFAFDHDALLEALKRNWDKIAPPAMFTAAGNITISNSENFLDALDTVKWNKKVTENIANSYKNNGSVVVLQTLPMV